MSKLLTLLIAGLLCSLTGRSQRASITVGEEDKTKTSTDYHFTKGNGTDIIRLTLVANKHGIGGFAKYSHTPLLSVYNKRMESVKEKVLPELDVNTSFDRLITMGNKIYLFTNRYEKESKSTSFYCQPVKLESLEPEGANILLGKFEMSKLSGKEEFVSNGNHLYLLPGGRSNFDQQVANYYLSSDGTKLLVAVSAPRAIQENEKYYLGVYDNNMTKVWDRTIELPYQSKFVDMQSLAVTTNGQICAVIKHYQTEKSNEKLRKEGESATPYHTQLLIFEKDKPVAGSYSIEVNGLFVHSVDLTYSNEGQLQIFGLYQQEAGGNCQGFFNAVIQPGSNEKPKPVLTAFSNELINQVITEKQGISKGTAGIGKEYQIASVLQRGNGSTDYILEYFSYKSYTSVSSFNGGSSANLNEVYNYGNIIDINIKDGENNGIVTKIPRFQPFPAFDLFGGFQAVVQNDKLLLLFNDDEGNVTKKSNESPRFGKLMYTTVVQMVVLDAMGTVKRSLVNNNAPNGRNVNISGGIPLNENTIAVNLYGRISAGSGKVMPGIISIK